jgi:molecular chaperone DnaJ
VTTRDYYEILGVDRSVDEATLKSSYRKLALKFHPDRNPGDTEAEEKFKEAAEAYSVLSDPDKRRRYDQFGHQGVQGAASGGFDPSNFADFSDIFGDFFGFGDLFGGGAGRRRNRPMQGDDTRYDLEIELEEAIKGKDVEIKIPRLETCDTCGGSGAAANDGLVSCSICHGRGEVIYQQGFLSVRRTCSQCNGSGKIIRRPCGSCGGEGHVRVEDQLRINIPAGVGNGTRVRVGGKGHPGVNGGPPGDLYVFLRVKDHRVFRREESDLYCIFTINVAQAALGDEIHVLTFDGLQTVKIPEGAQSGDRVRLRGLGVPHLDRKGRGDLYVELDVRIPTKLNRDQRRLFEELKTMLPAENEPREKGLFDKVKDYFM